MPFVAHQNHDAQGFREGLSFLVGAIFSGQGFENIGNRHHPGLRAHLLLLQAARIARAVRPFVVPAGQLGHSAQVPRERQGRQHDDGLDDVIVDDVAVFVAQGTARHPQVVQLAPVELPLRHAQLEAPGVVRRQQVARIALHQVLGLVGQERFTDRQGRRRTALLATGFIAGHTKTVVERAQPGARADLLQARHFLGRHEFAALIARGDKSKLLVEHPPLGLERGAQFRRIAAGRHGPPEFDFGIALEYLEAHPHFVDTVVEGFQLGRLVDDILGRRHLAAIVQPPGDVQGLPFVFAQLEIGIRARRALAGRAGQHLGQFGHTLAMAAGIRALGIDGAGHQLNQALQQGFLGLDQPLVIDRHRRRAGQGLDERNPFDGRRPGVAGQEQHEQSNHVLIAILQRHGDLQHGLSSQRAVDGVEIRHARRTVHRDFLGQGFAVPYRARHRVLAGFDSRQRQRRQVEDGRGLAAAIPFGNLPTQGGRQQALTVVGDEIDDTAAGFGAGQRFQQHPVEQALEIALGAERGGDVEELADRPLHLVHGLGQLVDFPDRRAFGLRAVETETADLARFAQEVVQFAGHAARQPPRSGNRQTDHEQGDPQGHAADMHRLRQQLVLRRGHQQTVVIAQRQRPPVPGPPVRIDNRDRPVGVVPGQAVERRHGKVGQSGQAPVSRGGQLRQPRTVARGQNTAPFIHQHELAPRGDLGLRQRRGDVGQGQVGRNHGPGRRGAGEGLTDLTGREKDIGLSPDQIGGRSRLDEPGADARIEIVIFRVQPQRFVEPLVVINVGRAALTARAALHALEQIPALFGHLRKLGAGHRRQTAKQEKIAIVVADVDRRKLPVLLQELQQHGQVLRTSIEAGGADDGVIHQQLDQGFERTVKALQIVGDFHRHALENVAGGRKDDAARLVVVEPADHRTGHEDQQGKQVGDVDVQGIVTPPLPIGKSQSGHTGCGHFNPQKCLWSTT